MAINTVPQIDLSAVRPFSNIEFLAKQVVEGFITGLHKSPYHGFSVEFAEHKQYNTNESTRFVDWKIFNKTDKLYVKRFEEETNLRCQILLDISSSMYYPTGSNGKLAFAALAAGSISYMLHKQRDAIGLITFSDKIIYQSQTKSTSIHLREQFLELQRLLSVKSSGVQSATADVMNMIAEKIHKRSLIIILSDMLENSTESDKIFNALRHLKHNKHEVLLFHIMDQNTESNFNFEEKPYIFIDIETGERAKLNPAQVKKEYQKSVKSFAHELKIKCGNFGIEFIEVDSHLDYRQVLLPFLVKRSKMV